MFSLRRRAPLTSLTQPSELDYAWFKGFAYAAQESLRNGDRKAITLLFKNLPKEEALPALLVFTDLVAPFSSRKVASLQPFLPWTSFSEAWGETYFQGFRTALALRRALEGDAFHFAETLTEVSELEVRTARHFLLEFLASVNLSPAQAVELEIRGIKPYTLERWPGLPPLYSQKIHRFDAEHQELSISPLLRSRDLSVILALESRDSALWDFVGECAREWNEMFDAEKSSKAHARFTPLRRFSAAEITDPYQMADFIDQRLSLEVAAEVAEIAKTYLPTREVGDCFQQVSVYTTVVSKPHRSPTRLSIKGDFAVIEVDVCKEELRQAPELKLLTRIYLDRIADALEGLPRMHLSTRHVLEGLRKPCSNF